MYKKIFYMCNSPPPKKENSDSAPTRRLNFFAIQKVNSNLSQLNRLLLLLLLDTMTSHSIIQIPCHLVAC